MIFCLQGIARALKIFAVRFRFTARSGSAGSSRKKWLPLLAVKPRALSRIAHSAENFLMRAPNTLRQNINTYA